MKTVLVKYATSQSVFRSTKLVADLHLRFVLFSSQVFAMFLEIFRDWFCWPLISSAAPCQMFPRRLLSQYCTWISEYIFCTRFMPELSKRHHSWTSLLELEYLPIENLRHLHVVFSPDHIPVDVSCTTLWPFSYISHNSFQSTKKPTYPVVPKSSWWNRIPARLRPGEYNSL